MKNYIKGEILGREDKVITYAEFMEHALYHPQDGYYMRVGEKVGRSGDFITASNISDIYGKAIARWFHSIVNETDIPPAVCEIGAGSGRFAQAFIAEWNEISTNLLHYYILETSPYHRQKQAEIISFNEKIKQISSLDEIKPFRGLIFSNELFDALPVHVIEKKDNRLMEVMISVEDEEFVEKLVPLTNEQITVYVDQSHFTLKNNQRIEIPLMMEEMIERITDTLDCGIVLTVDYGYTDEEWMEPSRRNGSLRGYYKHQQKNDILLNVGEMDITSHVHFDSYIRFSEKRGLNLIKFARQDEFFLSIGLLNQLKEHFDPNPFSEVSKKNRAIRSLIMPSGMSTFFHALIQTKGLSEQAVETIKQASNLNPMKI